MQFVTFYISEWADAIYSIISLYFVFSLVVEVGHVRRNTMFQTSEFIWAFSFVMKGTRLSTIGLVQAQ